MLNQQLMHLLNQRVRLINKNLNEHIQVHGLYGAQWSIMYYLYKNGAKTQKEITDYFLVNAPTITRTVKRMEENGWAKRLCNSDILYLLGYWNSNRILCSWSNRFNI